MKQESQGSSRLVSVSYADIERDLEAAAASYNLRNKPWSPEENAIALRFYKKVPMRLLAKKLNRTAYSIRNHCQRG